VTLKLVLEKDGFYLALSITKPKAPILRSDSLADGGVDTAMYLSVKRAGAIPLVVNTYSRRKLTI